MVAVQVSDSVWRLMWTLTTNPLSWWIFTILALYLMERFELGPHSFPWNWRKKQTHLDTNSCSNGSSKHHESTDGPTVAMTSVGKHIKCVRKDNGVVPQIFHRFIQTHLIPTFRMQCKDKDDQFAVLILSQIDTLHDVGTVVFRQVTFNGTPLVDSRLTTYPEKYRYDNYIVARSAKTEHPEALIAREVPTLLAAFRKVERCYIRNPVPRTGIFYSWNMPCSQCTELIVKSLSGACRKKVVIAYTQENAKEGKKNLQCLVEAGFTVVRINPH